MDAATQALRCLKRYRIHEGAGADSKARERRLPGRLGEGNLICELLWTGSDDSKKKKKKKKLFFPIFW